jgi:hypothetical protein
MRQEYVGRDRGDADGCRRYMVNAMSFDTRARILNMAIEDTWDPEIQQQWRNSIQAVRQSLIHEFGNADHERKISDFAALEAAPWSVIDLHNEFIAQIHKAFVTGAYYPALVASGALGERILNQLIIRLRGDYSMHPAYEDVAEGRSFSNWRTCITALEAWHVLDGRMAEQFKELNRLRNRAIHYGEHLNNSDARQDALTSVLLIQRIVEGLFAPVGGPPIFITGTTGHSFISRASENIPLIKRFYIPACVLVSPKFEMRNGMHQTFEVFDDDTYQDRFPELTDEEFVRHHSLPSGGAAV